MYKFTNGLVVFTEEDKENFLKAGLVLEKEEKDAKEEDNAKFVEAKSGRSSKTNSRVQR